MSEHKRSWTRTTIGDKPLRILIVEDRPPEAVLGSGYGRMIDTIGDLQAMGDVHVSLFPTLTFERSVPQSGPLGAVEIVDEPLETHLERLERRGLGYDVVIVSRPHNYEAVARVLEGRLAHIPIIYDAEALYFRRIERQAALADDPVTRATLLAEAAEMRDLEERIAREVDEVVCIAEEEAALLAGKTKRPVWVNGPLLNRVRWTEAGFEERSGIGFIAGWSAGPRSPNVDGLRWFARHVWPRVLARVPSAVLYVTGVEPPVEARRFACESIQFIGFVPDLSAFYARLRLAIVPIRYGSGVKLKAVEALQYGVPTVATTIGAENIPFDVPGLLAIVDDPGDFAESVALYGEDRSAWERQRLLLAEQRRRWSEQPGTSIWPSIIERTLNESGPDSARAEQR